MLVSEGLAENYAATLFGEEFLGPWVTKTDKELMPLIKEIIMVMRWPGCRLLGEIGKE